MKLLALVLLLSAFPSLTLMEVVESFPQVCPIFFMVNPQEQNVHIVPTIFPEHQYKLICQRWNNGYRFATVYDTERRIPVYSAYTFTQKGTTKSKNYWKIEPQLENITEYNNMSEMIDSPREAGNITHQAVDSDYINRVINNITYTRGHVFPRAYAGNRDQAESTFTLTNIAPQSEASNGEWDTKVETPMLKNIINICKLDKDYPAYIVTGVVPGDNWLNIERNNKIIENGINIPSHYWSAFCCKNNKGAFISEAYIAKQENFKLVRPSLGDLNNQLSELYGQNFSVFPGLNC